jgi:hypothetical protein
MPTGACHRALDPVVGIMLRLPSSVDVYAGWYQASVILECHEDKARFAMLGDGHRGAGGGVRHGLKVAEQFDR